MSSNDRPVSKMHSESERPESKSQLDRRSFVKASAALASASPAVAATNVFAETAKTPLTIGFPSSDSLVHPPEWESLNPGYWQIKDGRLRRRLKNIGDRARRTGFPFHYESKGNVMQTDYDPSLPSGIIYRRDVSLRGRYQ